MTLSRWLRDYLYIPLGGSRNSELHTYRNLFITFLLGGLWHGAGWTFVIWGALHGGALMIHRLWKGFGLRMPIALGWLTTFLFANFAWVFFRAENFTQAIHVIRGMFGLNGISLSLGDVVAKAVESPFLELISPSQTSIPSSIVLLFFSLFFALLACEEETLLAI